MFQVIYMTGAPAAGKSSAAAALKMKLPQIEVFEYGARLTEMVAARTNIPLVQDDIRKRSALLITKDDVDEMDRHLEAYVSSERKNRHIIIDSHPVTKEEFGFRVTAFSADKIVRLAPTEIWVLFASATETIARIRHAPAGRPVPNTWEADFHTQLQASVAAQYGVLTGTAVHLFDTAGPQLELVDKLAARLATPV